MPEQEWKEEMFFIHVSWLGNGFAMASDLLQSCFRAASAWEWLPSCACNSHSLACYSQLMYGWTWLVRHTRRKDWKTGRRRLRDLKLMQVGPHTAQAAHAEQGDALTMWANSRSHLFGRSSQGAKWKRKKEWTRERKWLAGECRECRPVLYSGCIYWNISSIGGNLL